MASVKAILAVLNRVKGKPSVALRPMGQRNLDRVKAQADAYTNSSFAIGGPKHIWLEAGTKVYPSTPEGMKACNEDYMKNRAEYCRDRCHFFPEVCWYCRMKDES